MMYEEVEPYCGELVQRDEVEVLVVGVLKEEEEEVGDYLLNTVSLHDCFFVVGSSDQSLTEKIGAVKVCLMNQSVVFRNMLHNSRLAERGDIVVPDIQPKIFKLLLRHCYGGLENCQALTPDDCVLLCYAAEKYMLANLKRKIADRLKPECVPEIFPALHCLVNYNLSDLEQHITKMIEEQTMKIFSDEGFLEIDMHSVTFIVKQKTLNCPEIEIWKAVLKWATQQVQNEEGTSLRYWISGPLKHVRLMTLSYEDLCKEVLPTNILTAEETCQVCTKSELDSDTICTQTDVRGVVQQRYSNIVTVNHDDRDSLTQSKLSNSCLIIGNCDIMLDSVTCLGYSSKQIMYKYGLSYIYKVELVISRIGDFNGDVEDVATINFTGNANYFVPFNIPTLINNKSITLKANTRYRLHLNFEGKMCNHPCWCGPPYCKGHDFDHGTFYCSFCHKNDTYPNNSHIIKFNYSFLK